MISLKRVKRTLFRLPLESVIKEGIAYSEPIMTIVNGKVIDNYFTYSIDYESKILNGVLKAFGVDSEACELVYVNDGLGNELDGSIVEIDSFNDNDMNAYEALYERIREIIIKETFSEEEKKDIAEYVQLLNKMSQPAIFEYYKIIGADFFKRVERCGVIIPAK